MKRCWRRRSEGKEIYAELRSGEEKDDMSLGWLSLQMLTENRDTERDLRRKRRREENNGWMASLQVELRLK